MHVRDLGRFSGPTVLVLHDCPAPAEHVLRLAMLLARTHRVLVPDMPGYGHSVLHEDPLASAESDLVAHVRGLGLSALDVVGVGLGSYRALRLALSGALPIRRLVSLSGFARLADEDRRRCQSYVDILSLGGDLCDSIISRCLTTNQRDADPELVERLRGWVHAVAPATLSTELSAMAGCADLRPRLAGLTARTLVLHGFQDNFVPPTRSEEIAMGAPRAQIEMVAAGHLLLEELSEQLPRVRAFLLL